MAKGRGKCHLTMRFTSGSNNIASNMENINGTMMDCPAHRMKKNAQSPNRVRLSRWYNGGAIGMVVLSIKGCDVELVCGSMRWAGLGLERVEGA